MKVTKSAPPPLTLETIVPSAMKLVMNEPLFKVGEAEIRGNTYRVFENIPDNLADFFAQTTAALGDAPFLSYGDERLSFAELQSQACRFANAVQEKYGVKKGDHVAIAMRNYPEWCAAYMGLISLGAVVVPLNAWWKSDELRYGLEDSGAKLVIVDAKRLEFIKPFKAELGLTLILAHEKAQGADATFEDLVAGAKNDTRPSVKIAVSYTHLTLPTKRIV